MLRALTLAFVFSAAAFSSAAYAETKSLVVAGGCFWCVEKDFEHVNGVIEAESGYAGGNMQDPTYRNHGNHREVVRITYDSAIVDYQTLVSTFLRTIDVLDGGGQFCDRGRSYSPAIHAATDAEMQAAKAAVAEAEVALGRQLAVPVEGDVQFWIAEDYHQDYYKSDQLRLTRFGAITRADAYKRYREACGRDARVRQIWGDEAYKNVNYPTG
ncbi:MAG: peptide-methionine (S)-S-oxide reductase MsrA [Pseudomonadota bacterium]